MQTVVATSVVMQGVARKIAVVLFPPPCAVPDRGAPCVRQYLVLHSGKLSWRQDI